MIQAGTKFQQAQVLLRRAESETAEQHAVKPGTQRALADLMNGLTVDERAYVAGVLFEIGARDPRRFEKLGYAAPHTAEHEAYAAAGASFELGEPVAKIGRERVPGRRPTGSPADLRPAELQTSQRDVPVLPTRWRLQTPDSPGRPGVTLNGNIWSPPSGVPVRGVVQIEHGLKSHSGRYADFAQDLVRQGFVVAAMDLRGHGESGPTEHVDVDRFESYIDDLQLAFDDLRERFAELPLVLYGHSMGGQIVARFALERHPAVNGIVLADAALGRPTGVVQRAKAAAAGLLDAVHLGSLRVFSLNPADFSNNPAEVASLKHDPLIYGSGTAHLATELLHSIDSTLSHATQFPVPVLLLHGGADTVTSPEGSRRFAKEVGALATVEILPGVKHDPLHDVGAVEARQRVIQQFNRWVPERTDT